MRGKGRVFQRGRRWWIAYWGFRPNGDTGEVQESAGETEEEARDLLSRRLREVANHRDGIRRFRGPHQERMTVADLLDSLIADYRQRQIKSLRQAVGTDGKRGHLQPTRAHFGAMRALVVNTDRVRHYIEQRRKVGLSNAKINRETELLGRAFKLAIEDGKLTYCPKIPALSEINARQGFFEKEEFEAVARHLPTPLDDLARFAYGTGWRRSELVGLRWENVDRTAREVRIPTSKSGEPRSIPLDETLWPIIERRWAAREYEWRPGESALSEYVFHRQGKPLGNFLPGMDRCVQDGGSFREALPRPSSHRGPGHDPCRSPAGRREEDQPSRDRFSLRALQHRLGRGQAGRAPAPAELPRVPEYEAQRRASPVGDRRVTLGQRLGQMSAKGRFCWGFRSLSAGSTPAASTITVALASLGIWLRHRRSARRASLDRAPDPSLAHAANST